MLTGTIVIGVAVTLLGRSIVTECVVWASLGPVPSTVAFLPLLLGSFLNHRAPSRNRRFCSLEKPTWGKAACLAASVSPSLSFSKRLVGAHSIQASYCSVCQCPRLQESLPSRGLPLGRGQQCQQVCPLQSGECSCRRTDSALGGPNTSTNHRIPDFWVPP